MFNDIIYVGWSVDADDESIKKLIKTLYKVNSEYVVDIFKSIQSAVLSSERIADIVSRIDITDEGKKAVNKFLKFATKNDIIALSKIQCYGLEVKDHKILEINDVVKAVKTTAKLVMTEKPEIAKVYKKMFGKPKLRGALTVS